MSGIEKYDVVLKPIDDEQTKEGIIKKLAAMTKKPEAAVAKIVEQAPVVIFKALDKEKAAAVKKHFGDYVGIKQAAEGSAAPVQAAPSAVPKPKPAAEPTTKPQMPHQKQKLSVPKAGGSLSFDDGDMLTSAPEPVRRPAPQVEESAPKSSAIAFDDEDAMESKAAAPTSHEEPPAPKAAPKIQPTKAVAPQTGAMPSSVQKQKAFKDNFKDLSDPMGHAYEFFCEGCNKSYRPDFFKKPSGPGHDAVMAAKWLGMSISGKAKGSLSDMKALELREFQKESFNKSLKMAEHHFLKCDDCGRHVCSSCWNAGKKKCAACAPLGQDDMPGFMRSKMEKDKRDKEARVKSKFCANCGAEKVDGAKFCEGCGTPY